MTKIINTVLIGLGEIGYFIDSKHIKNQQSHFKALKSNNKFVIKSIIEKDESKLKKINFSKNKKYSKIDKNLKTLNPELVVISTNTNNHYKNFLDVIKYCKPKVILFEKPFGKTINESISMNRIARDLGIKIFVNFMRNSNPGYLSLFAFLKKNNFKFCNCLVQYNNSFYNNASHWFVFFNNLFGNFKNFKYLSSNNNSVDSVLLKYSKANIIYLQSPSIIKNKFYLKISSKNFYIETDPTEKITIFKKNRPEKIIIRTHMHKYQNYVYKNLSKFFSNKKYDLITSEDAIDRLKYMYRLKKIS